MGMAYDTPVHELRARYRRKKTEINRAYRRGVMRKLLWAILLGSLAYLAWREFVPQVTHSVEDRLQEIVGD